jgi:hypothetical protein
MSSYNKTSVLATFGNFPIKASGLPVFSDDGDINAISGELMVFDPKTHLTLAAADIPTASSVSIAIATGNENQVASSLRYIAGEKYNLNDFNFKARVTRPSCGIPQVVDVFFDKLEPGKTYTFEVLLDDSWVRSNMGANEKAKYIYTVTMPKGDCEDCDPVIECQTGSCLFVDKVNGSTQKDPTKVSRFYRKDITDQYQPFSASQLYLTDNNGGDNTSRTFCISLDNTTCEDCAEFSSITGIKLDGVQTDFTFTTKPGDATKTLPGQVDRVISEINKSLESSGGSARLKRGLGKCCEYEIEINSCVPDILLVGNAGDITPKSETNPFSANDVEVLCDNCATAGTATTASCGFRIFVDPVSVPCNCEYPDNLPSPNIYTRTVEIQKVGDWDCTGFYTKEVCKPEAPEGFGYYYQQLAVRKNHNGGKGRDFRNSNRSVGYPLMPDEFSRFTNAAKGLKCDETYCVYNLLSSKINTGFFNNSRLNSNTNVDYLLIPQKDTVTKGDFETMLAALQARGVLQAGDIACDVPITGATMIQDAVTLAVGETVNLDATVQPANALQGGTWSTADASLATVDANGVVTGVATGTVVITFTASDTTTTATSTVTVS